MPRAKKLSPFRKVWDFVVIKGLEVQSTLPRAAEIPTGGKRLNLTLSGSSYFVWLGEEYFLTLFQFL